MYGLHVQNLITKMEDYFIFTKSHKGGLLDHELSHQAGTSQQISKDNLISNKFKKIYPNLVAGDCIIHHCEIIHGSNINKSTSDRVGLVMSFKNKKSKVDRKGWLKYQAKLKKKISNLLIILSDENNLEWSFPQFYFSRFKLFFKCN